MLREPKQSRASLPLKEVNDLFTIFDSYLNEMRGIISAPNEGAMTRVSRNNISRIVTSMQGSLGGLIPGQSGGMRMNPTSFTNPLASEDNRSNWRINTTRAHNLNTFLQSQTRLLTTISEELRNIHRTYVIPFENKDDEFASLARDLDRDHSSFWQRFGDGAANIGNFLAGIVNGAMQATYDLFVGLLGFADGFITYMAGGIVVSVCAPFGIDPPRWAQDSVDGVSDTVQALLNDPALLVDSLVLSSIDAIEEEGIGYAVGYVGLCVAAFAVTFGNAKKASVSTTRARTPATQTVRPIPTNSRAPGIVQSRINIASGPTRFTPVRPRTGQPVSAGWDHVVNGHFGRTLERNRSVFSLPQNQVKAILQNPRVVNSPATGVDGGQFVRIVDTGTVVGHTALKYGGRETTWVKIFTDEAGNLITTFPVPAP